MRAVVAILALVAAACTAPAAAPTASPAAARPTPAPIVAPPVATPVPAAAATPASAAYLGMPLVDVRSGERFTIGGFRGKVTLVMGMAVW